MERKLKTIRIKFIGFTKEFNYLEFLPYKILKRHFNILISDKPEYVFCSVYGTPYEYCKYEGVRILFSGENYSPDFNLFDYAIGFDNLCYEDRFIKLNLSFFSKSDIKSVKKKHININQNVLDKKMTFCNFIYGHPAKDRDYFFKLLQTYKRVDSPGRHNYNMKNGFKAFSYDKKLEFQRQCKFTIAIESTSLKGFNTEKIIHAFSSKTIPIYYGDPNISKVYNSRAFINCHEFDSFDSVLNRIIELDNDDSKYLEMLSQPAILDTEKQTKHEQELEKFLINIFAQNLEKAYRRSRVYLPQSHNDKLKRYSFYLKVRLKLISLLYFFGFRRILSSIYFRRFK